MQEVGLTGNVHRSITFNCYIYQQHPAPISRVQKAKVSSRKTICMVNLHTDTVNILTKKCGSAFLLVFLGFIHIAMKWKQKVWWGEQDRI